MHHNGCLTLKKITNCCGMFLFSPHISSTHFYSCCALAATPNLLAIQHIYPGHSYRQQMHSTTNCLLTPVAIYPVGYIAVQDVLTLPSKVARSFVVNEFFNKAVAYVPAEGHLARPPSTCLVAYLMSSTKIMSCAHCCSHNRNV